MKQRPGCKLDSKQKLIIENFKKYGLSITMKMNLYNVGFLEKEFDLKNQIKKSNSNQIVIQCIKAV